MAAQAKGDPAQSPYEWEARDYQGAVIRITITFNNATRALAGASVFRDAACVYTKILIGRGADDSPDSSTQSIVVPAGTTAVSAAQMASRGFTTIEQFLALQITAGR